MKTLLTKNIMQINEEKNIMQAVGYYPGSFFDRLS
jgi:hypothetical protein